VIRLHEKAILADIVCFQIKQLIVLSLIIMEYCYP